MNSMPPQTAATAAEPLGQPALGRVIDDDRLAADTAEIYEGIFARDSIAQGPRRPRRPQARITALLRDLNI